LDTVSRRSLIAVAPNRGGHLDYVVALEGGIPPAGDTKGTQVGLRYVPDKLVLHPHAFCAYLNALAGSEAGSLEDVAVMILDDINNEVVARWVQVTVSLPDHAESALEFHGIVIEDRQPKWDKPALLSRLKRF
jgi:7-cyano-7-deazaguanine reductase